MKVVLAEKSGFCFGVKMAIRLAESSASGFPGRRIYTIGEIIHNRHVVSSLEKKGVIKADSVDVLRKGDVAIIRSHGATPDVYRKAESIGAEVIDATCPFVRKAQEFGRSMRARGLEVVIIGKKGHPEVDGLAAHSGTDIIIARPEEVAEKIERGKKYGIIAQTTVPFGLFNLIVERIREIAPDAEARNTICSATSERQEAALRTARLADAMVVVGGRNSSNTLRLAELCSRIIPTYHIESASELRREWFSGAGCVGVTAGASTPENMVMEVVAALENEAF